MVSHFSHHWGDADTDTAVKTSSHNQLQIKIGTRCLAQNVLQQNVISKSEYVLEFWSGNDLLFWHALVPQTVMVKLKVAH
jgi:hypothetical protein